MFSWPCAGVWTLVGVLEMHVDRASAPSFRSKQCSGAEHNLVSCIALYAAGLILTCGVFLCGWHVLARMFAGQQSCSDSCSSFEYVSTQPLLGHTCLALFMLLAASVAVAWIDLPVLFVCAYRVLTIETGVQHCFGSP